MYSTNIQLTTEEGMVCELYNEFHDIAKLKFDIQKCVNEGDLSNVVSKADNYKSTWVLESTDNNQTKLSKVDVWGKTHYLTVLKESFDKINIPDLSNTPMTPAGVGGGMPTRWIYSEYGRFLSVYGIRNGISLVFNLASANDIETKLQDLYKKRDNGLVDNLDLQELEERLRLMSNITIYGNGSEDQSGVALQENVNPTTSPSKLAHMRRIQPLSHTDEANKKRRKTIEAKREAKLLGLNEEDLES